jgi:hypothetical protein
MAFSALEALQAFGAGRQMALQDRTAAREEATYQRREGLRLSVGERVRAGDIAGAQNLAAGEGQFDWATALGNLNQQQQTRVDAEARAGGEVARALRALPLERRAAAFTQATPFLRAHGFSDQELAAHAADLSDGTLDGHIANADAIRRYTQPRAEAESAFLQELDALGIARNSGQARQLLENRYAAQPRIVTGADGRPYILQGGSPTPSASDANLPAPASPEEARRLPPGTRFRLPDGTVGTVPGGPTPRASGDFQ